MGIYTSPYIVTRSVFKNKEVLPVFLNQKRNSQAK